MNFKFEMAIKICFFFVVVERCFFLVVCPSAFDIFVCKCIGSRKRLLFWNELHTIVERMCCTQQTNKTLLMNWWMRWNNCVSEKAIQCDSKSNKLKQPNYLRLSIFTLDKHTMPYIKWTLLKCTIEMHAK